MFIKQLFVFVKILTCFRCEKEQPLFVSGAVFIKTIICSRCDLTAATRSCVVGASRTSSHRHTFSKVTNFLAQAHILKSAACSAFLVNELQLGHGLLRILTQPNARCPNCRTPMRNMRGMTIGSHVSLQDTFLGSQRDLVSKNRNFQKK